jgi:Bacterial Ig-like domain/LVIVD repeat
MKHHASALATAALFSVAFAPAAAHAALGNLTYTQQELNLPISSFNATTFVTGPGGSNTAAMVRDVFIVMGSNDSGKPPGAFHVFDVKDPRHPKLLKTLAGTPETNALRELHAMPLAMIDGKDIMVFPAQTGLQFFDFTDPMNITPLGFVALPGVNGGDYDNAAWMLSWSWPYVYAGGTGNGVYIVDGTDPTKPTLVSGAAVPIGKLGNFRVGPTYAAGNYLIIGGMDQGPTGISVVDVSDPTKPFLLITGKGPTEMYSAFVVGDRIFGTGATGNYSYVKWTTDAITTISTKKFGADKGGYCSYQDGFFFCGQSSEGFRKIDVHDEKNMADVGHGDIPNEPDADTDFATVMGNLVYLGNDHGSGAAFMPHSMTPDMTPPQVFKVYPGNGDVKQPLSTRVTMFFSDEIDIGTINNKNLVVRKNGCTPVDGVFSHSSFNAVSFGPKKPLDANATYEVVIVAGGVKDLSGNPLQEGATIRFSTGMALDAPIVCAGDSDAGVGVTTDAGGGAGGAGAGSGGAPGGSAGAGGAGPMGAGGTSLSEGGSSGSPVTTGGAPAAGDAGGCGCMLPGRSTQRGALWFVPAALWIAMRRARVRRPRSST